VKPIAAVFLVLLGASSFSLAQGVPNEAVVEVTFDEAIALAMKANPRIALAQAAIARAEAVVVQSRAAWLPTLTANATLTELEANRSLGDRVLVAQTSLGANLQLAFPLLAVPRWLLTGQLKENVDIANEDKREMARALASLVGRAWLSVRLQERLLQVAKRALASSDEQLRIAQTRGAGGLGSRLEIVRAYREQSDNAGRMARAAAEVKIAKEVLAALLAQSQPVGVKGEVVLPDVESHLEVSQVVDTRSDVKAAAARAQLALRIRKETTYRRCRYSCSPPRKHRRRPPFPRLD
jgi:outer membrane protein TolC